jgi:phenylpropionate dioxygenase-like ring-hydroxylating dioxygenase large terminal subunit
MTPTVYSQGEAFQVEKRTLFAHDWLPLCAAGQLARPGDFVCATVGGWSVIGARGHDGIVRVLRNACRHQNMQVVAAPSGHCESFRCRFHGWTYDLQGRFLSAPPPVAPRATAAADLHLASLASALAAGMVLFTLAPAPPPLPLPQFDAGPQAYAGTLVTDIACNWKVCIEHLLSGHDVSSADFVWAWPLMTLRRADAVTIVEQVVPHTFLRTRLFSHVFGAAADDHRPEADTIKRVCEDLQADRAAGRPAADGPADGSLVAAFHRRLTQLYAEEGVTT